MNKKMKKNYILRDMNGWPFLGIPRSSGALAFHYYWDAKDRCKEIADRLGEVYNVAYGPDHPEYNPCEARQNESLLLHRSH